MTIPLRSRRRLLAIGAAVALTAGLGSATSTAAADEAYPGQEIFTEGHADVFFVTAEDDRAVLQVHDDRPGAPTSHGAPEDYVFHVKPSVAERTVNWFLAEIPGFADEGDTVYVLPQNNVPGTIFAGFGHALPSGSQVTYSVADVQGPGRFATWQAGDEGPSTFLNQAAGLPTSFTSQANHEHMAWGFSELGEYQLTVSVDVALPSGETLTSDPATYTFYVGEELPTDGGGGTAPGEPAELNIEGLAHHYHAGGIVRLNAVTDSELDHYHWFTRAPGATEWTVVPGATSGSYGFIALAEHDGLEVMARLYGDDHGVVAESAPVTIAVDDHGNAPVEGPGITATLGANEGTLVVSLDEEHREVELTDFALTSSADRYVATGDLGGIRVTDTRPANVGWNVSGRMRGFTTIDGERLGGDQLGWDPTVVEASTGQTVEAAAAVDSALSGGPGIGAWTTLATAPEGASVGTSVLGAGLTLEAPATLVPGTYRGVLILTAI